MRRTTGLLAAAVLLLAGCAQTADTTTGEPESTARPTESVPGGTAAGASPANASTGDPSTAPAAEPGAGDGSPEQEANDKPSRPDEPSGPNASGGSRQQPAPPVPASLRFSGSTLDGKSFRGSSLAGEPTVFWFWAPWCHICRGQIPTVTKVAAEHTGQVNVVAVGGLDSEQAITDLADDIPHVTHLVDTDGAIWRHFEVTSQSTFTVLDAEGEVVAEGHLGEDEFAATVDDLAG